MQQKTKPFVHPIRSHMKDIIHLRQTETAAPETVIEHSSQNMADKNVTSQVVTSQLPVSQNTCQTVQHMASQHISGQHVANQYLTGQQLAGQQGTNSTGANLNHQMQGPSEATHILQTQDQVSARPVASLPPSATVYNNVQVLPSSFPQQSASISCSATTSTHSTIQFTGPVLQRQNSGLALQANTTRPTQTVTVLQVAGLPSSVGSTPQPIPVVSALHQLGAVAVPVGGVLQQPVISGLKGSSQVIHPTQQVGGAPQQIVGASQPMGMASQMNIQPQLQLASQHTHTITTSQPSSHPQASGWGLKLSSLAGDPPLAGGVPGSLITDTPITTPGNINTLLPFSKPDIDEPNQAHSSAQAGWPTSQTLDLGIDRRSSSERLPSYSEALQAKTAGYQVPIYNQVSVDGTGPIDPLPMTGHNRPAYPVPTAAHPMTSNTQHLPVSKDDLCGVTLPISLNKGMIDSSISSQDWPLLSEDPKLLPTSCGGACKAPNTLKVSTLTRLFHKSHVDDLTLAATPKGTGEGYGVGLDLSSLLGESLPMDADQER